MTIVDVGELAGVSIKTVSRVLNGQANVSDATRDRVHAAAKALNYYPNVLAQGLVRRRSHLVGLVYENPSPSYVVEVQQGVLHRLRSERYQLVVIPISSIAERAAEVVGLLRAASLDGVILAPPASNNARILADLTAAGIRCARIASTHLADAGPSTIIDDEAAAREIAMHLIRSGHRRIGIIKGDPTHAATDARHAGYLDALTSAGLTVPDAWIEQGMFTRNSGYLAARRLLASADRPTAVLAQNDDMAVGALIAARELGLSVPEDLSIVGFDDSEIAQIAWPAITTIRQPVFDMAVDATDMLIALLEERPTDLRRHHRYEMIVRGSSGPPPGS